MWCPEGYVSLAEIAGDVFMFAQGRLWSGEVEEWMDNPSGRPSFRIDTGTPIDECEAYSDWFMGRFLEQYANDIRVACPNGAVLRISPHLLSVETDDPFDYNDYRTFPRTREGRLRAGSVRPLYVKFEGMRITDNLAGQFDEPMRLISNYPLCIPQTSVPTSTETLVDLVCARAENAGKVLDEFTEGNEYKKLAQDMISAWDRGELPTKAIARARFGRGRGSAEWMALWQSLTKARPPAAKSGRRSGKNR